MISYAGKTFSTLKNDLTQALIAHLSPIRDNINHYLSDKNTLLELLKSHSEICKSKSEIAMQPIRECFGFLNVS